MFSHVQDIQNLNKTFYNHLQYFYLTTVEKISTKILISINYENFNKINFVNKSSCTDKHSIYFSLQKFLLKHLNIAFDTSKYYLNILSHLYQPHINILKLIDTLKYIFLTIVINLNLKMFFLHPIYNHQHIFYLIIMIN